MRSLQRTSAEIVAGLALLFITSAGTQAEELRPLAITDYGGELAFEFLYETETAEGETRDQEFKEQTYLETVGVWAKGYIYHPNLLDFDIGLKFGLGQERESGDFGEDRDTDLLGYDIHLAVEKKRPYGVDLFALKDQEIVAQKFAVNSIVDVEEYIVQWDTDNDILPTSIQFFDTTKEQSGISDRREEEQRIRISSSNQVGDISRTNIRYLFRDFAEKVFGTEVTSHDLSVTNRLNFDEQKRLESNLTYSNQQSDAENEQITYLTNFTWEHTTNLESFYTLNISDSSVSLAGADSTDTLTHYERVGLRHQLYENLVTEIAFDNNETDSDTFTENRYGGRVNFSYSRPIPAGSVSANLGYSLHRSEQESEEGVIPVIDESHVLIVGFPVFLNNNNVDLASVFITDAFGTPLVEGLDYELRIVGNQVQVVRLRDPVLPIVGDEILVDYVFTIGGDAVFDTTGFGAGAGLFLFRSLNLTYQYTEITTDFIEGDSESNPISDLKEHRIDVKYFKEDLATGLIYDIKSFYQDHDSTFSPFKTYGASATIGVPLVIKIRNMFSFGASYTNSEFTDTGDETDSVGYTASVVSNINPMTILRFETNYREISGDVDESTDLELRLLLEMRVRSVTLSLEAMHLDEQTRTQDRETDLVFFRVARTF
jgi:hypothetical protein